MQIDDLIDARICGKPCIFLPRRGGGLLMFPSTNSGILIKPKQVMNLLHKTIRKCNFHMWKYNKMKPTNPNAHTYENEPRNHSYERRKRSVKCKVGSIKCGVQNATPATEFAPCHHFAQRWQCDSQKTRNTTRLKCCKWHRKSPKCCACHEKCNASSESVSIAPATQSDLLTHHETCWNVTKCHACQWSYATLEISKSDPCCRAYQRHGHSDLAQTVANTAQPPRPQSEAGTLATHLGKKSD